MPGINGIEATRRITTAHPGTVVLLVSTYRVDDLPADAAACGAADYVNKEDLGPDVVTDAWSRYACRPEHRVRLRDQSGMRPVMRVPLPGAASTTTGPADGTDAVGHVHEAVAAVRARRHVEAGAVVGDDEQQRALVLADVDRRVRAVARVLAGVLERLEAAEVHRRLDRLVVAPDARPPRHRSGARRARRRPRAPR